MAEIQKQHKVPEAAPPEAAAKAPVPFAANAWALKESANPGFYICVPAGTTVDDCLSPAVWANVAGKMRPYSTIEVHWADGGQFAEFYVESCGRNWAGVWLMRHHVRQTAVVRPIDRTELAVSFNGPVDKYRVTRLSDNAVLQAGFASSSEAQRWADEYRRKLAA